MDAVFQGVRVLDLGQIYNGPYCGLLLALHGADVIKLEPPGGERLRYRSAEQVESHEFMMLNSNKRSIIVDLKNQDGQALFRELLGQVDIVIENLGPGAMAKLGLDPQVLTQDFPRLIYASGKGYGSEGPYAHMPAMDITVQAMSGVVSTTGFPGGPPVKAGPAFVDFLGGIHLFAGISAALYHRERTGRGQFLEVSMHDTVYPTLASALGAIYNDPGKILPERTGNMHSGMAICPYNVYRAKDGWLAIISVAERHFEEVVAALGSPKLASDPRFSDRFARVRNMTALDTLIEDWTSAHDRAELLRILGARGVPCAPVMSIREVADDPHLLARGMIREVEHPVKGTVRVPASPIRFGAAPMGEVRAAPALAQDTDDVLRDLLDKPDNERARLRANGAVQ
jgi:crotonobetainyl-CoA:carnitine CoA-transferase CaiB-like acyl-CoA transferase